MTGAPEGSTENISGEARGIEPATPSLQGIALIHCNTAASRHRLLETQFVVYGRVPWLYQYWPGGFMFFCGSMYWNSRRLNRQWLWF